MGMENGGVMGTQLGYEVVLGYVELYEAMHADGSIGASAGDKVHPPPAPSPFASKCPKGVWYLVTSTGRSGFPKGEQQRCISDGNKWRCEHGRVRSVCKECGGASICEHGRVRRRCKECGGSSICEQPGTHTDPKPAKRRRTKLGSDDADQVKAVGEEGRRFIVVKGIATTR